MKTAAAIARFVLGLVFVVFGLNGFLNFMPMGPVPALAGQFAGALIQSHYMAVVLTLEIVSGLFLLPSDRGDCRRALGCERVPVSSAPVATLPATIRRRGTSGVAPVAAELHRAVSLTRNPHWESSVEQLRSGGEEISHERRTFDEISRCRGIRPRFA